MASLRHVKGIDEGVGACRLSVGAAVGGLSQLSDLLHSFSLLILLQQVSLRCVELRVIPVLMLVIRRRRGRLFHFNDLPELVNNSGIDGVQLLLDVAARLDSLFEPVRSDKDSQVLYEQSGSLLVSSCEHTAGVLGVAGTLDLFLFLLEPFDSADVFIVVI
jgi:hypothetical protein